MLDPQASRFWQAALQSGLVDGEALAACWNAIPAGKREALDRIDRRLARQAVQSRALTLWQAQQLLAGRTSGYKVDRYTLLDLIGQGGMGRVYLARDTRLNRRVALKILSPERVNNPRAIARFQREARVGAQLEHENLVRIYDFGESNGRYYLVMEYIEGKTIGTLISEQGALSLPTTARLIRQVALGLEHAHRKGLIHRDVNPYNVLVTLDGIAKLADLGLAIDLMDEERVTREGATVGTFDYVAPEQARQSHSADIRSDIYSLGCTFYHMCTGQVPFPGPSLPEKLFAHQALDPVPIEQLTPNIPEQLSEIVRRMMRKSPDERYAAPLEVALALEPFVGEPVRLTSGEDVLLLTNNNDSSVQAPNACAEPLMTISGAAQSERSLAKTVGEAGNGMTNLSVSPASAVRPRPSSHVTPPLNPSADIQASDSDYPLDLDFGAEPALGEGLARPKSKSASDYPATASYHLVRVTGLARALVGRAWYWSLVVSSVAVTILAFSLALTNPFGMPPKVLQPDQSSTVSVAPASPPKRDTRPSQRQATINLGVQSAIVVRKEGEEDVTFDSNKLLQAMQTAMGKEGWVELRNRNPLHVSSEQAADLASGRGRLIIRASSGIQPVIDVEMKGNRPFLSAGSAVPIELSGITLVVRYPETGPPSSKTSNFAPVIVAATTAKIDRCAFKVAGNAQVRGSRALFSSGGSLFVGRCWFQGFEEAIEIAAMGNARAQVEQTIILPMMNRSAALAPDWYGWAIKLSGTQAARSKSAAPQLVVDHCTLEGAGFLDLTGSAGSSSVRVDIKHCAIRADAVLACTADNPPSSQLGWRGEGNQYDIRGPFWIVLRTRDGISPLSPGASDLDSWTRLFSADSKPIRARLRFLTDPAARSSVIQPYDFAVEAVGSARVKPGADPDLVGPWSER